MLTPTRARRRIVFWSALNFFLLLVLWALENFAPEKFWPVSILVFLPQHLLALPALALGVLAWRSRQSRLIGLQIPAALFFLFGFLGFNIPLRTAPPRGKTLRAMTFNIRSGSLGIGKIAALVAAENPEILCVQEGAARFGFPDPLPVLKKSLPQYHVARFSELAIFSKFPITKIVRHALPEF